MRPRSTVQLLSRRSAGLVAWMITRKTRSARVLITTLLAGVLATWYGASIEVDTDLRRLLPKAAHSRLGFADVMVLVERDAKRIPLYALLCFSTLVLGAVLTVAIMGLWPIHLNFFNLVVMPAVIGLGIDTSIHRWHGHSRLRGRGLLRAVSTPEAASMMGSSPAAGRSFARRLQICVLRILIALFVTGGAVPTSAPSVTRGFDVVEKAGKAVRVAAMQIRTSVRASRCQVGSHCFELDVPRALTPTRMAPEPQIWMRPRRIPPPDDDGPAA